MDEKDVGLISRLKSLCIGFCWKPSEERMKVLQSAIFEIPYAYRAEILKVLINDLKRL